jgi:hypothetical protein
MRSRDLIRAGLVLAALATALHFSIGLARAETDSGSNAALQYWQAFALLPPVDADLAKRLENWQDMPRDATVQKLLDDFELSRKYMLRASRLTDCDWGLEYRDGEFLQLPYLGKARILARLAALHARREFESDRWASGVEDVQAVFRLARHLEAEPIMAVQMAGFVFEATAIEASAPYLRAGGTAVTGPLGELLETWPPHPKPSEVIRKEKQVCVAGLIHRLEEAEAREEGSWRRVWQPLTNDTEVPVTTFQQAVAAAESMSPFYDRLAREADLPWRDFDPDRSGYTTKLKAANRLAYVYLASMVQYVVFERLAITRLEVFRAALGIVRDGPDSLEKYKDPAGDGLESFRYQDLGGGSFRLSSRLPDFRSSRLGPRPVAVSVGTKHVGQPANREPVK